MRQQTVIPPLDHRVAFAGPCFQSLTQPRAQAKGRAFLFAPGARFALQDHARESVEATALLFPFSFGAALLATRSR